ncbi:MAG TPA: c-type cytochrome [Ohtaekwangia sp.]|nr:c-type cytochrome [Ohtaekwangia sp.]
MKKILKVISIVIGIIVLAIAGLLSYVKIALPKAEAAADLKIDYTKERIDRGKYLAHSVMICMDCHSKRDYAKFAAPMVPGTLGSGGELFGKTMGFPGDFYAPNLTPYHLKDWTDGELLRAITTGVSKDGRALFPVMPYHSYGATDKEDIYSVIAYIRTLEPIENEVPASVAAFPMNFIINTLPKEAVFSEKPKPEELVAYGKYLVTSAACGDCHTKRDKGAPVMDLYLAGGFEFHFPDGSVVRSLNITPDKETGIGTWTEEQFIKRFKFYADSSFVAHDLKPGDFKTVMPWTFYGTMKDEDLKAIYAYLRSVPPVKHRVNKFETMVSQQASLN